jgi:hypothetical protein
MAQPQHPLANIIPVATDGDRRRGVARPIPAGAGVFAGWGPKL